MVRVLFVCLGNICRSPMAEAVFMHQVLDAHLEDRITADSAATSRWELGSPPHHGTQRILTRKGIAYDHRARMITRSDLSQFDYVVTMDDANYADVIALGPTPASVRPLMDYAPHLDVTEVPDPYYTGDFDSVYELISEAVDHLLAEIRREHGW
jgi:protein-tyrosine phosphatase